MRVLLHPPASLSAFTPRVPASKYVANRALLLAGLAAEVTILEGVPESEDMRAATDFVRTFGATAEPLARGVLRVEGVAGRPRFRPLATVDLGESGTLARFALAVSALGDEEVILDGRGRLRERPMGELLDVLAALGARVEAAEGGRLPVRVRGPLRGPSPATPVRLSGEVSSQFASALLLVAPALGGLALAFDRAPVSASYLTLTREVMDAFGVPVTGDVGGGFKVPAGTYRRSVPYRIPPDTTALGYFAALAALFPATLRHAFPYPRPWTGEARALEALETMGARVALVHDVLEIVGPKPEPLRSPGRCSARDFPDSVPTLAALAATATGETVFEGVGHLRHKESDRIGALVAELARIGVDAHGEADALVVRGRGPRPGVRPVFDAHGDHRLAMSLALLAVPFGGAAIEGAESVAKSFPDYWAELARLGFGIERR